MNRNIDLRQLRYFLAVAQEKSFRRAAERLHITQPPLSRQISELEQALGVPLLTRDTRHVALTAAGELALREFGGLVERFERALEKVAAVRPALPTLRLGQLYWAPLRGIASLERALVQAGLIEALEVQTAPSDQAIAAVRRGELTAALVAAPIESYGLELEVLGQARLAAFVPAASPLARKRVVSLQDLNSVPPFFRFRRGQSPLQYDHFARQYAAHGFRPVKEAPANDAMGVFTQIGAGRGATCMPEQVAANRWAGVVRRPLKEMVTIDLALVMSPTLAPELRTALRKRMPALLKSLRGK